MKLEYTKNWYEKRIAREGDSEIGAGAPPGTYSRPHCEPRITSVETNIALGTFVELWRRNKGWDPEQLATSAQLDLEEILEIERDPHCRPEPDAIYKLAKVFGLPAKPLLEIAGVIESRSSLLKEEAVRFAARSESVEALNLREREAFEAFVATIAKVSQKDK